MDIKPKTEKSQTIPLFVCCYILAMLIIRNIPFYISNDSVAFVIKNVGTLLCAIVITGLVRTFIKNIKIAILVMVALIIFLFIAMRS